MEIRVPERDKKPGVCYIPSEDGVELPIVDITNAAFDPDIREATMPQFLEHTVRHMEDWAALPGFARRLMSGRSIFTNQASHKGGGFVSGMTTYLMKLGAANLGHAYARKWDYRMASSLPMLSVQLRLRAMARLTADGLAPLLAGPDGRGCALRLINIAGGPAADSWNTLLLLRKEHPACLEGRDIHITVLDRDEVGPAFGRRALSALLEEGQPLHGLRVTFEAVPYDWAQPEALNQILEAITTGRVIVGCSSEGGLFEYASDAEICANLVALKRLLPQNTFIVGSMFRNQRLTRAMKRIGAMDYHLRDEEPIAQLVCSAGWNIDQLWNDNPVYWALRLRRAD